MQEVLDRVTHNIKEIEKIKDGAKYKISIKVPFNIGWVDKAKFVIESDYTRSAYPLTHKKNTDDYAYFETEVDLSTKALYKYYFTFEIGDKFIYYKKYNNDNYNNISHDEKWSMSVNFEVPDWAQGAMMYQIFPDRFYKGRKEPLIPIPRRNIHQSWEEDVQAAGDKDGIWCNDFYGGDIKGMEEKLEYIKSLGISILYINPIVLSPTNHRYDTSDYETIDPYLGNKEDFRHFCNKAHKLGMKVVLDAVFNHTGNDSKYFNEFGHFNTTGAYQSKESPYYPFFKKHYANGQVYFSRWWGIPEEVECDSNNKEWRNYICGVGGIIDSWFALGIDGLRLDVADGPSDEFHEDVRIAVKRNKPDGLIIGEIWKNPWRMGRGYVSSGKGMDAVMNYNYIDALIRYYKYIDVNKLKDVLYQLYTEYSPQVLNASMTFTSTHDMSRGMNIFSCDEFAYWKEWGWDLINDDRYYQRDFKLTKEQYEKGKIRYKNYVFNLAFFPGTLSIFYGDEIGMQGLGNIACRRPYPWNDKNIDYDLLNFFKGIGIIRNKEQHLRKAEFRPIDVTDKYLIYERLSDIQDNLVIISNTSEHIRTPIPEQYLSSIEKYNLYNSNKKELDSYGALVLKKVA